MKNILRWRYLISWFHLGFLNVGSAAVAGQSRRTWLCGSAFLGALASRNLATASEKQTLKKRNAEAGYGYRRPQFEFGSRLVFQGDSITDMKWGRNEKDRNHYLGHSYVYLIAARLGVDLPEAALDVYNRGVSGHKIADLRKRWDKDAIGLKPDLLSVLVGVNDVGRHLNGVDLDRWEGDYRFMLNASRSANSNLRIVLLDPFVVSSGRLANRSIYQSWRGQVERLLPVVARLADDFDAVHVRTQMMFDAATEKVSPEHWIWDGVHPLPQGHELIAREWIAKVSERWPL